MKFSRLFLLTIFFALVCLVAPLRAEYNAQGDLTVQPSAAFALALADDDDLHVLSVTPSAIQPSVATTLTIEGRGFLSTTKLWLGSSWITPTNYVSQTLMTAYLPDGLSQGWYTATVSSATVTSTLANALLVDGTAPSVTVQIDDYNGYIRGTYVTLKLNVSDALGTVSRMVFSNDGVTYTEAEPYAPTKAWTLAAGDGDGLKHVYVIVYDTAGNASPPAEATSVLDSQPPTGTILINNGAQFTASYYVTLTLQAQDSGSGIAAMRLSNESGSGGYWESYTVSRSWLLSGDGNRVNNVFVTYRDLAGNIAVVHDSIFLDNSRPSVYVDVPRYNNQLTFVVNWRGSDEGSGVAYYDVQYQNSTDGPWTDWLTATQQISATFSGENGTFYRFRVRAIDRAGNQSSYANGATVVDMDPPRVKVFAINNGALDTSGRAVVLTYTADDLVTQTAQMAALSGSEVSGLSDVSFSNDGETWSAWLSPRRPADWTLTPDDGLKVVYARFRDFAGNISAVISDTIMLDEEAGKENTVSINNGDLFADQVTVTLSLGSVAGTAEMQVSNDGGFAGATWEPYSAHKIWQITKLGSYVIPRVVYVRYRTAVGVVSSIMSDDIILDVTPPDSEVTEVELAGRQAALTVPGQTVHVQWSGNDDVSGVDSYDVQVRAGDLAWSDWLTNTTKTEGFYPVAPNRVYAFRVRATDNAGNHEAYLDAKVRTITIAGGQFPLFMPAIQNR